MKELYELINVNRQYLNKSERDISQYLLANEQGVPKLKLQQLADNCYVSKTSVIRLCKKLGFNGYNDLQFFVKMQSEKPEKKRVEAAKMDENVQVIWDNIQDTLQNIDMDKIRETAEVFCSVSRLDIYGLSSSRYICQDLARKLNMLGIWANEAYEDEMIYLQSSRLEKGQAIFVISLTGNNDVLVDSIEVAKNREALAITLTNNTMNRCAAISDHPIYVQVQSGTTSYNRYRPRYIFMIIIELIIEECIRILDARQAEE